MNDSPIVVKDPENSRDNQIRPFQIEGMDVRGRAVRLGTLVEQVLSKHNYPDPVAEIVGEMLVLVGLLGSMLKFDGIVTIQTKSKGPVGMIVADYTYHSDKPGVMRAYAQMDEARLATYGKKPSFKALVDEGYLALTIDQGENMERYQGIVDLNENSLSDSARNYFQNSEQTPTEIKIAIGRDGITNHWRAGGIMVQHLARGEVNQERILERDTKEQWTRASVLLSTAKDEELIDPLLDVDALLFRLFNEDGVRVFEASPVEFGCRCSRERLLTVLQGLSDDDIAHAFEEEPVITANCEFCNSDYIFTEEEVAAIRA